MFSPFGERSGASTSILKGRLRLQKEKPLLVKWEEVSGQNPRGLFETQIIVLVGFVLLFSLHDSLAFSYINRKGYSLLGLWKVLMINLHHSQLPTLDANVKTEFYEQSSLTDLFRFLIYILQIGVFLNRWRLFIQQCSVLWKWSHSSYLWSAVLLCCGLGLPKLYFSSLPYISTTRGKVLRFFWVSF